MPYRSKTKLRKAVTNHSPNRLSRPPSPASPLFDNVGLLVVFFRPAALDHESNECHESRHGSGRRCFGALQDMAAARAAIVGVAAGIDLIVR
jgi:hypothetical protein